VPYDGFPDGLGQAYCGGLLAASPFRLRIPLPRLKGFRVGTGLLARHSQGRGLGFERAKFGACLHSPDAAGASLRTSENLVTLVVFLNQARATCIPCLESLSWSPPTAGWVASSTASAPRYVYRTYCTVPPATVNCGLRIADCGLARRTDDQFPNLAPPGHFVTSSLRYLPSESRPPNPGSRRLAVRPFPSRPVTKLPSPPPLPMLLTPHSALRILRWNPPPPTYSVCQNGSPRDRKVINIKESICTGQQKDEKWTQFGQKRDKKCEKRIQKQYDFALPILTFGGPNPLGASARADSTPPNPTFGVQKWRSKSYPQSPRWPPKRPDGGTHNRLWSAQTRRNGGQAAFLGGCWPASAAVQENRRAR
jgi:hypothetical protein